MLLPVGFLVFPIWVGALAWSAQGLSRQLASTQKKIFIWGVTALVVIYVIARIIYIMSEPLGPDPL